MLLLLATALAGDPLFDLGLRATAGSGGSVSGAPVQGLLARGGFGFTGWVSPRVGLGGRADFGSYAADVPDDTNLFLFAEARYRITDTVTVGAGVGTPVIWIEYYCVQAPCPSGPWEYHAPIGVVTGQWDLSRGALLLVPGLRAEVGGARWGVGVDLEVGLRARRRDRASSG